VAVDPGSVHVGLAQFTREDGRIRVWAAERGPDLSVDWLWDRMQGPWMLPALAAVAVESFRVRSGAPLGGDSLKVVRMIGAIEAICRRYQVPLGMVTPGDRAAALTRMRAAGLGWAGAGNHAHDAQAVGLAALRVSTEWIAVSRRGDTPPIEWPEL
jgi:hypothetical protein